MSALHLAPEHTVLVVEDDASVRMVAAEILEDAGLRVLEAEDADRALSILEAHPEVAALFTDVDMPGSMNGIALCRRVSDRWPAMRLVLTSGRRWGAADGVPDVARFVAKPYRGPDVLRAVAA